MQLLLQLLLLVAVLVGRAPLSPRLIWEVAAFRYVLANVELHGQLVMHLPSARSELLSFVTVSLGLHSKTIRSCA
jgi:hypothetical protein